MKAKKHLGQHFLNSEKALTQIVDAGDIHTDDIVLEIGPGQGVLTERLLRLAGKVVAIEKDKALIPLLEERFSKQIELGKFDLIEGDVLDFDTEKLRFYEKKYKLIANIPYYITGAIIEQFLSASHQPEQVVLLVQKEVAERAIARDKKQSVLSIAIGVYGEARIVAKVPAGAFVPAPKVDSAILSVEKISRDFFHGISESEFFSLLKACFGKKRKQLGKSLGDYLGDRAKAKIILEKLSISEKTRPETLAKESWRAIVELTSR